MTGGTGGGGDLRGTEGGGDLGGTKGGGDAEATVALPGVYPFPGAGTYAAYACSSKFKTTPTIV